MAIRVLIADDEPSGRTTLRLLLAEDPEVQIVGECRTGAETVSAVLRHRPDLLFLDIQMPDGNGFEVLAELPANVMPLIVFVTAYDRYSLQAFEVHAVDYLLKPFSDRRFRSTLAHAKDRLLAGGGRIERPVPPPSTGRIAVRTANRVVMLAAADVDWVEARGDYARIHAGPRTELVRESLTSLEARLGTDQFVRVHRSAIVNLSRVRELRIDSTGRMVAQLANGTICRLSRRGRERLAGALSFPL